MIRTMNRARAGEDAPRRRLIPVSVKTRLGYDSVIVAEWIAHLLHERPAAISLHGRTLAQMYRGEADWTAIARATRLVQGTGTLLLGNGDVHAIGDVVRRVRETGVHGILVGRGTLGSPWFFGKKEVARAALQSDDAAGLDQWDRQDGQDAMVHSQRFRVMIEHARTFEAIFGRARFPRMRKHLGWYCKGFPHAAALRNSMVRASSAEDVERLLVAHDEQTAHFASARASCASVGSTALPCA